jgi:hypothetical protein
VIHNNFKEIDFDSELRNIYKQAFEESCCLMLHSSDFVREPFIQKVNLLFSHCDIPCLFVGEDHAYILATSKEKALVQGNNLVTEQEAYQFFIDTVKSHLHIIYLVNPDEINLKELKIFLP